ncbi:MAG: MFS transporter [Candidatus Margulisiibacteriota bacterium]
MQTINLPKNVKALGLVSFFTDVSSEMIYSLLPVFMTSVLGLSPAYIGVIEGIAESTASILKVFSGWISDRFKKRKILILIGYGLSTVVKPFLALSAVGWHVLAVRFLDRTGKGIRTAPRDAVIADSCLLNERGKAFGFHRAMDTMGAVVGPLLAFIILPLFNQDFRMVFLLSFIPALLALLLIVFFVREKVSGYQPEFNFKVDKRLFSRDFKIFIFTVFIFTIGNSSNAFLILRARDVGVGVGLIPILWMTYNLVYSLVSMPAGILSDKIGRKAVILLGFLLYSMVYLGFAFADHVFHIWLLFCVYGIFYGLTEGTLRAFVADLAPPDLKATTFGIYHAAVGLAVFPASIIMGILWQTLGITAAFSFGGIMALIAAWILAFFVAEK